MITRFNHAIFGAVFSVGLLLSVTGLQAQPAFRGDRILVKPSVSNLDAQHQRLGSLQSIRSSIAPQAGRVATDLHLPVLNGDQVLRMINGSYVTYTFSGGLWSPSEPSVSIGESFWNNKNASLWWQRNFQGWP